jgi:hypothetical protein
MNALDRSRIPLDQGPHLQRLENATAAVRKRSGSIIETRLIRCTKRTRLDEHDSQPELIHRQSQTRSDKATTANGEVERLERGAHVRDTSTSP